MLRWAKIGKLFSLAIRLGNFSPLGSVWTAQRSQANQANKEVKQTTNDDALGAEHMWIMWLVIAAIFAVVEISTSGFIALWFGIGAGAAALTAALGFGAPAQLVALITVSTALTLSTRRIFLRWLDRPTSIAPAFGDSSLVGKRGIVLKESKGVRSEVELELDGTVWTALPVAGDALAIGEECEVVRIEGNQLYVRATQRAPDWKLTG
ncbi:MAG: hypothetical protein CFK52_05570 [Chloracidobacterium sp. CP2_5A]|nr:MAG: hypothetical protein CFK52_05570 [Chloracidobacterium sp. CP2_5A]